MTTENFDSGATGQAQADKEIIACEECEYEWHTRSDMNRVTCPNCQHKTPRNVIAQQRSVSEKWITSGAESLEEMAVLHEERSKSLRTLSENGWSLRGEVRDGLANLRRVPAGGGDDEN